MSDDWLSHIAPKGAMFEHAVDYISSLRMDATSATFFGFSDANSPLIEVRDSRVVAAGYQRSHVEDGPHQGVSAPDGAFAPQGATVRL